MALLTGDRRSVEVRIAVDGEVQNDSHKMPLGDDPLSVVAASGRIELAGIRSGNDTREWLPGYVAEEQSHSQLTVPVTVGRNVIGALSIQSTFRNAYSPRDKELLTAVALHTGIAIENARLYRLVQSRGDRRAAVLDQVMAQQEIERKELVDDIHDDTLQTLAACLYRLDQARVAVEKLNDDDPALAQSTTFARACPTTSRACVSASLRFVQRRWTGWALSPRCANSSHRFAVTARSLPTWRLTCQRA